MGVGLRQIARRLFGTFGIEVRRKSALPADVPDRQTLREVLLHAASVGFSPATVIDVGAAEGTFTRACRLVFPSAAYVLIEPLEEFARPLAELARELPRVRVHQAAAASRPGEVTIHVHEDLFGSSLQREAEGGQVDGTPRVVPSVTLDGLLDAASAGPCLLKLDVQGAELEVLRGAPSILAACGLVLAEVSLFRFFENGPLLSDLVAFMAANGFVVYDLFGCQYRPLDGALSQVDMAFVKDRGLFRGSHAFATPEQRKELNRRFAAARQANAATHRGAV